ncbi:MazG nucleotide pyrophosphohydrolase domain protein [Lentilactobacillus kisonensis F0435]|uniref:MazG nucleotide pyrophosphohydrolase domain protein n=1 Tax=Lentilactobacillus kisonensis F0435 TaxID=797516 RepID=H1LHZ9_9LACO|nr:MazG nucleotide pyrophosphohydrolase domain protein [Lentilactobacillus kisonensis F0435]
MTEEVGELFRAIRAIEIGRDHPGESTSTKDRNYNLHEELADVMDQVLILCDKYDVDPDSLMAFSEEKLKKRFDE